jgi:phage FluMu protein gp41
VKCFTKTKTTPRPRLFAMDISHPSPQVIADLFNLHLVDGIAVQSEGKTLRYKAVRLRETSVADERAANLMAERVVIVGGMPKLMASESDFRYAMTMRHIEHFGCDGLRIPLELIDLDLFGKLSSHDLGLIEERVFLITMAAEVRYGAMTQAEFDALLASKAPAAPQPGGQAAELGSHGPESESGPALLADYAGAAAHRPAAGDGR